MRSSFCTYWRRRKEPELLDSKKPPTPTRRRWSHTIHTATTELPILSSSNKREREQTTRENSPASFERPRATTFLQHRSESDCQRVTVFCLLVTVVRTFEFPQNPRTNTVRRRRRKRS